MIGFDTIGWKRATSIALATFLACSSVAYAQSANEVESLAASAQSAYKSARYGDAVALYLKAYRLQPAPILLYNVAYIYDRKLDEPELASNYYRRYITSEDAEPDLVQKATVRLSEIRRSQASAAKNTGDRPMGPSAESMTTVAQSVTPSTARRRQAGYGLLGAGGVVLATGIVFGVLAQQEQKTFATSQVLTERTDARDAGKTYAITGDVLMAVGAVSTVTGLILALTATETRGVRVGGAPVAGGAVVLMTGRL